MPSQRFRVGLLALVTASAARHSLRSSRSDPLDAPDLRQYDPVKVLCTLGKDDDGKGNIKGWCRNWLSCIKEGASPQGDASAVRAAWKPAPCKEYCGKWPRTTPAEGSSKSAKLLQGSSNYTKHLQGGVQTFSDCLKSCENFQKSLTTCVAKILFEPGKVAAMGIPGDAPQPKAQAICTVEGVCMPDLAIRYQKCLSTMDHSEDCEKLEKEMEECKDCPSQQENFQSHYHAFVGGCMDQLHAYWSASHPGQGPEVAVPGATGCQVH